MAVVAGGGSGGTGQAAQLQKEQEAGARQSSFQTVSYAPTGTTWYMPVAGMKQAPGNYAAGTGNWSKGSFGYQKPASKGGHVHTGTDIYAEEGTAIVSPVAGTVLSSGSAPQSGNYVRIRGTDGVEYYFAHMQHASPWKTGARVQAGIYVGAVGKTGNASGTTPHLHFAMKKNGKSISPNAFLETGRQQKHTPLSAIPGLNTPEEIANWAIEESKRQAAAMGEMQGFDTGAISGMLTDLTTPENESAFGTKIMSSTMDAFSRRVAQGDRTPIPTLDSGMGSGSTALDSAEAGGAVPEAEAILPEMAREESLEVT